MGYLNIQSLSLAMGPLFMLSLLATPMDRQVSQLEMKVDAISEQTFYDTYGAKTLPVRAEEYSQGIFAGGDALYWKTTEDDLDFVRTGNLLNASAIVEPEKTKSIHGTWDWGYRANLGYAFPTDGWDTSLIWTHYQMSSSKKIDTDDNPFLSLQPTLLNPLTNIEGQFGLDYSIFTSASAHWKVKYNVLDLEFGRNYFISRAFSLRPFFGFREAWIKQHLDASYQNRAHDPFTMGFPRFFPAMLSNVYLKNEFTGFGLRAGSHFNYYFTTYWSIFAKASASILHGKFEVENKTKTSLVSLLFQEDEHLHRMSTNLEGGIGLQWASYFRKNKTRLTLSLLYEWTVWFNQNQWKTFQYLPTSEAYFAMQGDLGFQGGTATIRVEF